MALRTVLCLLIVVLHSSCKDDLPSPYEDGKNIMFTNIPSSHSNINFRI
ncbi:hypothetical protein SAMN05421824_0337 [Hyunsoonleella jejuensis]|uniref:Uncharacterized protein n=1 Tax=Hyunsoonleella jejuensis TaxID=419940 RepID=A0A1H9ASS2_9FLAO|nr:hypothetical protein SAMN05421824_0337 [Hyunsoonleella jejuensis]